MEEIMRVGIIIFLLVGMVACGKENQVPAPAAPKAYDPSVPVNNECPEGYDVSCNPTCECLPHAVNTGSPFSTW